MAKRPRIGRPKKGSEETRRDAQLDAAMAVFARKGFGRATMDDIARRAGAAKRTLYESFGTKDRIFEAVVAREAGAILAPMTDTPGAPRDLRGALEQAAYVAFKRLYTPAKAAIFRMVMAEAQAFPDLARGFYDNGPGQGTTRVAAVLGAAAKRGEIVCRDPKAEARRFASLVVGEPHLRFVLGLDPPPTDRQARARAQALVDFFLRALAR